MSNNQECSYDQIVYDTLPHKQGNLIHLETVGDIYQIAPVDCRRCRVLELGTATGKTIIPQAEIFPESEFIGIDLSPVQIEQGNKLIQQLGLTNIQLQAANILDVDSNWGKFDYIIVHGIYSWVPQAVREKILEICRENLSEHGLAMVSYNVYPGWYFKNYARELMLFHSKVANQFSDVETEVQQARAILNYAAENRIIQESSFNETQKNLAEQIKVCQDYYIYHEYLEDENHPFLFTEFNNDLKKHDLGYVSDFFWADYFQWMNVPAIKELSQRVKKQEFLEQYIDFFTNRTFRSSVFSHNHVAARKEFRKDLAEHYRFYFPLDISLKEQESYWCFIKKDVEILKLKKMKLVTRMLKHLERRSYYHYTAEQMWELIQSGPDQGDADYNADYNFENLKQLLNHLIKSGVVKPFLRIPEDGGNSHDCLKAHASFRAFTSSGQSISSNPFFESIGLDLISSFVLQRLDGVHSTMDIVRDIQREMKSGLIQVNDSLGKVAHDDRKKIIDMVELSIKTLQCSGIV